MKYKGFILIFVLGIFAALVLGCNQAAESTPAAVVMSPPTPGSLATTPQPVETVPAPVTSAPPTAAPDESPRQAASVQPDSSETNAVPPAAAEPAKPAASLPFTATTGLAEFSAYRLQFTTSFDGLRQGQPTSGSMEGRLEVTRQPEAQHWQIKMNGAAFQELALLGDLELYSVGQTLYLKNPQDGAWLGVPKALVEGMLPAEMYEPEKNIDLPARAILQPGEEMINGVMTRRYTFGAEDVTADGAAYDQVDGAIWVAVDGDYVVKYEASFSGRFDDLSAGGLELLDEGTISMRYEVSDVNGEVTIAAPAGAASLDLGSLLFR